VISLEEWVDIVSLHRQGWGIKKTARELGISRNAVRRALLRGGPPEYHRDPRPSKLDPHKDYLVTRLTDFPDLPAITLFEEIRERGYVGGMSILKDFTYPYRRRRREPVVRFETPPGHQAQVDWAHLGRHELSGVLTPLYLFTMVLGYSRALYAEVVTTTELETFLALHVRAFACFGGMPEEILPDYVPRHIIILMFPPALCGGVSWRPLASWRCTVVWPHNDHRESSQRSSSWSSRHAALRGNPGE
jgi:transposase